MFGFVLLYYQMEYNDVAVCRVWSYGRSSMVGKSPECGATVVTSLVGVPRARGE